jgi:hypothetical protein
MNYNYNYDYLTYNFENKNKINPYPNIINNINDKNNIIFNNDKFVNGKNERKNSNSFVKVKKIDRRMYNEGNTSPNANMNEFNSNTYNSKNKYNRNYGRKYENDFNDQNKIKDNKDFNNISEIKYELNNSTDNEEIRKAQNNLNFKKQYMPMEYPTFDDDFSDKKKKKNKYNCYVKKLDRNINDKRNDNSYHNNEYDDEQKEKEREREKNLRYKDEYNIANVSDNEKNNKKSEKNEINDSKIKRMKNNDGLDEFDNNFNNHDKFYNKMKNLFDD